MERLAPESLRASADTLENPRRLGNVERITRAPDLDQQLLLALNKSQVGEALELPNTGTIRESVKDRLISVTTADMQTAVLGAFCTNITPFSERQRLAVGVFPLHGEITRYSVVPHIDARFWATGGELRIIDGATAGIDPFLIPNPDGLDLLFFKQHPFKNNPYKTVIADDQRYHLPEPTVADNALEDNVCDRAIWYMRHRMMPKLFTQGGFRGFLSKNQANPKYFDLHAESQIAFRR